MYTKIPDDIIAYKIFDYYEAPFDHYYFKLTGKVYKFPHTSFYFKIKTFGYNRISEIPKYLKCFAVNIYNDIKIYKLI